MGEVYSECGVGAVIWHDQAAPLTFRLSQHQQHRGQESWGILVSGDDGTYCYRQMGLVPSKSTKVVRGGEEGDRAIGHVRYSLTGSPRIENAHPHVVALNSTASPFPSEDGQSSLDIYYGNFVGIVHNGNFNSGLAPLLEGDVSDTRQFLEMVRLREGSLEQRILQSLEPLEKAGKDGIESAYSMILMDKESLIAVRDPRGFRPLSLGKIDDGYVVASETCAIEGIGAKVIRDVERGEMLIFKNGGLESKFLPWTEHGKGAQCAFCHIYLADPNSVVFGRKVEKSRYHLGRLLAQKYPANADVVVAIPESGHHFARGYADQLGLNYDRKGLYEAPNWEGGRIFITPGDDAGRKELAEKKIKADPLVVYGKRVVVVDDSIVGGINAPAAVKVVKEAGATEVHLRIGSPPYVSTCHWGVATYNPERLIARRLTKEELRKEFGADSLGYLDIGDIHTLLPKETTCVRCFKRD